MLYQQGITSLIIKDKYENIKGFYVNKDSNNIYNLTPHSSRYTTLEYTLKFISLPFTIIFETVHFLTSGNIACKYFNIGKIFLDKMNQNISKKILHGLPEEHDKGQTVPKIVEQVLEKYEEQPELINQPEDSFIKKSAKKIGEYIPGFSKFMNFWNNGGINYSNEIQKKQPIIDIIYKKIISEAYNVGKKGEKLQIKDVEALFPEVDFKETVKLDTEKVITADYTIACKESTVEQDVVKEIEPITIKDSKEIIEEDSEICNQETIEQNIEEYTNNSTNAINPLVKLMTLFLYDSLVKIFEKHCAVEDIYSKVIPATTVYPEQSPYFDNALLGDNNTAQKSY